MAVSKIDMSGGWTGNIQVYVTNSVDDSGSELKVEIGVYNTGGSGSFTIAPAGTPSVTEPWTSAGTTYDMSLASLSPSEFDLAQDEYLALRLTNMGANELRIRCEKEPLKCYLTFEGDDPAYPVPELSALLLTSIGVLMLGGFIVYSRRRDKE